MGKSQPQLQIAYELFTDFADLDIQDQELVQQARQALGKAYAPYSNFWVGASLLLANQQIVQGCNQENLAYPSGLCAERVALFSAGVLYPAQPILKLAVIARHAHQPNDVPGCPCGACRQVMVEFEQKQQQPYEVIFLTAAGFVKLSQAAHLLPFVFQADLGNKG
ncbi:MAG TPA: cytidine deaminase [Microscillaceae bacterium]|nr:cytidine deaminase [Microscillaceae bacterium]